MALQRRQKKLEVFGRRRSSDTRNVVLFIAVLVQLVQAQVLPPTKNSIVRCQQSVSSLVNTTIPVACSNTESQSSEYENVFSRYMSSLPLWSCACKASGRLFHMHQVQGYRLGIQGPPWLCTVIPWPVHLCCRPSKLPRTSLFLQRLPRPASSSLLHCWQPSIFGCWTSGVELPATRGYVGVISDNFPHSTQDVSVHWVISWYSAYLTFLCLHTVYSGPSSVLNTWATLKIHDWLTNVFFFSGSKTSVAESVVCGTADILWDVDQSCQGRSPDEYHQLDTVRSV